MKRAAENGVKKLYHYQALSVPEHWKWLSDTLTTNRVRFSDVKALNDPWDCRPQYSCDWENSASRAAWKTFFERLDGDLAQIALSTRAGFQRAVAAMNKEARERASNAWNLYCLTPYPDSLLMWAHYGGKHAGVCLEFDTSAQVIGNALQVEYVPRPTIDLGAIVDLDELAQRTLLIKSTQWEYEREYRLLARREEEDPAPTRSLPKTRDGYLELPPGAITGIVVGCRADGVRVKKLTTVTKPSLKVQAARQDDDSFQVILSEIP